MSKYAPLTDFLARAAGSEAVMTFAEIERVIGQPLPASKKYPAWWSNNPGNNVMTRAWLAAGYHTERVDIAAERLVFRRTRDATRAQALAGTLLERIQARLGGTVTVAAGVDLAAPVGEIWDAER